MSTWLYVYVVIKLHTKLCEKPTIINNLAYMHIHMYMLTEFSLSHVHLLTVFFCSFKQRQAMA